MKIWKIIGLVVIVVVIAQPFAVVSSAYNEKYNENKYVIDQMYDKDRLITDEYSEFTFNWFRENDKNNKRNIILVSAYPFIECEIREPVEEDIWIHLIPDRVLGRSVVGIKGSAGCRGFDLNPENKYMKCIDRVIFSKDGKTLMSYPRYYEREVYNIPAGTETIAHGAFEYSSWLKKVTIPESVKTVDCSAFLVCSRLSEVVFLPNDSNVYIDDWAFHSDNLEKVMLPSFNVRIGRGAFNRIENVPKLVTYEQPVVEAENKAIKWDKIPNASYYEVYQKLNSGKYKLLKTTKGTSCRFGSLKSGSEYTFAVKPIAVISAANYDKENDEGYYPETFTIEGTMSEDITVTGM